LELTIPRIGKRVDAIIVFTGAILVVEYKVGALTFDASHVQQVYDYALILKNFHVGSHDAPIIPILYATNASRQSQFDVSWSPDRVANPVKIGIGQFGEPLRHIAS
jgi:hypothetical protein